MEVDWSNLLVMSAVVVFGGVVAEIFLSRVPSDTKFFIFYLITDVEIAHFHGARALLFDRAIGDAGGCGVITMNGGRRLWMS